MNKFAEFSEAMPIMVTSTATGSIISSLLLSNKTSDMRIAHGHRREFFCFFCFVVVVVVRFFWGINSFVALRRSVLNWVQFSSTGFDVGFDVRNAM